MAGLFQKPEDIIGMKPEELKAKLDSAVTKDDLRAVSDAQATFTSSLDEIKNALKALTTRQPDPTPEPDPEDPTAAVLNDPTAFINKTTQPLANATMQANASVQELRARQNPQFARIFAKYGDELVAEANKLPLNARAQDNFWQWHIRTFMGDKFVKGDISREAYPTLIGTSSVSPNPNDPQDPNQGLDPEMAAFYKQRNIPLEQAKKLMSLMSTDEHITIENVKGAARA